MKQRPIKFRVWNRDRNCWVKNLTYCIDDFSTTQKEWHIVEQFTGLHDRNGKEIYEGDKVKRNGIVYEVVWYKSAWHLMNEDEKAIWHQAVCNGANPIKVEVIGNIHENPELLIQPTP